MHKKHPYKAGNSFPMVLDQFLAPPISIPYLWQTSPTPVTTSLLSNIVLSIHTETAARSLKVPKWNTVKIWVFWMTTFLISTQRSQTEWEYSRISSKKETNQFFEDKSRCYSVQSFDGIIFVWSWSCILLFRKDGHWYYEKELRMLSSIPI